MAGRFCRSTGRYAGLCLFFVDPAFGCEDNCSKSTESIALSVILCIAAVAAIICPLLCLFGPFKQLAIRWRIYLHDKLGWEYPQRNQSHQSHQNHQRQFQVEYEVSTGNDVPPEYVNIAFIDLPPSYDEVVKNSQYYKYGPASVSASENHYQRQESQERPGTEPCHQISRRLEPSLINVPNASVQEPKEQTNTMNQVGSMTIQDADLTDIQEPKEQSNNIHQLSSITIQEANVTDIQEHRERSNNTLQLSSITVLDANVTNIQEPSEQANITHQSSSVTDPSASATTDDDYSERSINVH